MRSPTLKVRLPYEIALSSTVFSRVIYCIPVSLIFFSQLMFSAEGWVWEVICGGSEEESRHVGWSLPRQGWKALSTIAYFETFFPCRSIIWNVYFGWFFSVNILHRSSHLLLHIGLLLSAPSCWLAVVWSLSPLLFCFFSLPSTVFPLKLELRQYLPTSPVGLRCPSSSYHFLYSTSTFSIVSLLQLYDQSAHVSWLRLAQRSLSTSLMAF